jgi:ribonucleoside-diphosphate reductase alpha chain
MAKEGSTISGLMDCFATAVSYNLQYGVPMKFFVDKFSHVRFEPGGYTGNPQIPIAKSIMDYIFRWLGAKFLGPEYAVNEVGGLQRCGPPKPTRSSNCRSRRCRPTRRCAPNAGRS